MVAWIEILPIIVCIAFVFTGLVIFIVSLIIFLSRLGSSLLNNLNISIFAIFITKETCSSCWPLGFAFLPLCVDCQQRLSSSIHYRWTSEDNNLRWHGWLPFDFIPPGGPWEPFLPPPHRCPATQLGSSAQFASTGNVYLRACLSFMQPTTCYLAWLVGPQQYISDTKFQI